MIAENPKNAYEMMEQIPLGLETPNRTNIDTRGTSVSSRAQEMTTSNDVVGTDVSARIQDVSMNTVNAVSEMFQSDYRPGGNRGGSERPVPRRSCSTAWM